MYKIILLNVCLLLVSAVCISAQTDSYLKTFQEKIEKNPKDVDFSIKFKNDQNKFRQGEIIPLELKFQTSTPNVYVFLNRTYDRSGRLHLDGFIIDKKEKTFDPLYDYYYRGSRTFISGGLFSNPTLSAEPIIINYDLNEFFSFKEPGKYRIYIASPRVSLKNEKKKDKVSNAMFGESVSLVSNILEFEILPADKKWQEEKLAEGMKCNCKILRYLGTKAAAKEMLIRFSRVEKNFDFDDYIGLYGSPEREFIVSEMERMLVSADYPVTFEFFRVLVRLKYFLNVPEPEKSETKFFGFEDRKETAKENLIKLDYLGKFAAALPNKNENAFQKSLETYFSFHADGEKTLPELANALTNNFGKLSKGKQWLILQNSWEKLKNPAMLPVLQNIYNDVSREQTTDSKNSEAFTDYYNKELLNLSLKGIYELAPNIGKQLILDELRRPKQRVYTFILGLLPEKESPETESLLLEKLNSETISADDLGSVFDLIKRYETPKLIAKLRQTYANKIDKIECDAQIGLLQIFLKSDLEFGTQLLDKAVKSDSEKGCIANNLQNTVEPHWSPEIEKIVLSLLENENSYIFGNAAKLLGKYGSIETKNKIWKRFERFNKEEQSKEDFGKTKEDFSYWQLFSSENNLAAALSESPNWFFDQESKKRLSELCLFSYCKERVEKLNEIFNLPAKIQTVIDEENKLTFSVAQYKEMSLDALKKKLEQFPSETTFTWIPNTKNHEDEKNFQEIKEFLESRQMKLVK